MAPLTVERAFWCSESDESGGEGCEDAGADSSEGLVSVLLAESFEGNFFDNSESPEPVFCISKDATSSCSSESIPVSDPEILSGTMLMAPLTVERAFWCSESDESGGEGCEDAGADSSEGLVSVLLAESFEGNFFDNSESPEPVFCISKDATSSCSSESIPVSDPEILSGTMLMAPLTVERAFWCSESDESGGEGCEGAGADSSEGLVSVLLAETFEGNFFVLSK